MSKKAAGSGADPEKSFWGPDPSSPKNFEFNRMRIYKIA